MTDVFVSYKRENLAAVGRLVEALRAESVGVWWDQDIPPNAAWEATIEAALTAAKLVIVAWSPAAVASENVKAEARWARGQGRLLQVFVEACEPPLFFGERQGVDLNGWSGSVTDPAFRSVLETVRTGLETSVAPGAIPDEPLAPDTPPPLPSKPSIAVLPFANLSGDPEQEYFADGMVEEITAALSRINSIFVIASGSSLSFKGKGVSPQETARQLGVRYVLEGSVRQAGGRVRIAVKLIDAADGAQVWAGRFEDTLEDVFALQDKVALDVAGVIEPTVLWAEVRRVAKRPTENMGHYDLFLRAYQLFATAAQAPVLEALGLANRIIANDPDYALALAMAASCHYLITVFGWSDDPEASRRLAVELAHRALRAGPDDPTVIGRVVLVIADLDRDLDAAIALVDRATAISPGNAMTWAMSGALRVRAGDADLACEHLEMSLRFDPMGPTRPIRMGFMANARFLQGRFAEAAAGAREYVQKNDSAFGYAFLAASYGHLGQAGLAQEALARYRELSPQSIEAYARTTMRDPAHIKLFLDGIALAEGENPEGATP